MREGFIGLDIGTSSVRAVLFDTKGNQKYMSGAEYSMLSKEDGRAEFDPNELFDLTVRVIKDCTSNAKSLGMSVEGMGLSCQMHSLMAVDKSGKPLTNVMTWADVRALEEADFIKENYDIKELYKTTGCRIQHPMYPISKILWLKNNCQDIFNKSYKFITIKEYIIFRLYGEYVVDHTLAACQGYFNIRSFRWEGFILEEILGIGKEKLSEAVDCLFCFRSMKHEYLKAMGFDTDIPVVIGSGDGIMANLGSGVVDNEAFSSTIGTSGAIRTAVDRPLAAPYQETWCYPFLKDTWVAGGAINNGGIVLKWLKNEFLEQFKSDARGYKESIYRLFDRYASQVKPGSDGLIFLPYLTGERSPDWNAGVRGVMYGLSLNHGRKHIIRAAMEGILYRLFSIYEVLAGMNARGSKIIAGGGYAKSEVWLKMQADIFNKDIYITPVNETSALGAAYLCMAAVGAVGSLKELLPAMKVQHRIEPDIEVHELYKKVYKNAMEIYNCFYRDRDPLQ
ncbi:MAG: gluconokinase [Bacillota bacterium]